MRTLFIFLFCFSFVWSCTPDDADRGDTEGTSGEIPEHLQEVENLSVLPVDSEPSFEIDLVRETNFGDIYDDIVYLGYINDFAVDEEGRVYLADMSNDQVQVYNPDGSFLQSIGRTGRGPAEFLSTYGGFDIGVNDDFLFVYDQTNFRISSFSLSAYELVEVVNIYPGMWNHTEEISGLRPFRFFFRDDGTYLVNFRVLNDTDFESPQPRPATDGTVQYYHFNHEFELVSDKILEYELPEILQLNTQGQRRLYTFPFTNLTLTAFSESGHIYKASSEEFLIHIYEPDGSYSRSVYSPVKATRFTDGDREKLEEENDFFIPGFRAIDMPEQWPLLNQITADDEGRIWISVITESHDFTEWWVLDENNKLLAKFPWPRDLDDRPGEDAGRYIIKNEAIYHLSRDRMDPDAQTVIKYRIEMSPI